MARTALVKNGVVEHVVMSGHEYEPPAGYLAVASPHANIGDHHDGQNFKPAPEPDMTVPQLLTHARRRRQLIVRVGIKFDVAKPGETPLVVRISATSEHRADLDDHAYLSERDLYYSGMWVDDFGSVELDREQFLTLRKLMAIHIAESYKTFSQVVAAINRGEIRKRSQVDRHLTHGE